MITVVPSFPASSYAELKKLSEVLDGVATELQVDIVDGKFVPPISWPFTESIPKEELKKLSELPHGSHLELDCMVKNPEQYLDIFVSLDVKRVIVHMRSTDAYNDIIAHARKHNYMIGFAFTNDVPLTEVTPYIDVLDFVQIMGIKNVGKQKEPFDERTLETVHILREQYPHLEIAVDGSVNAETIPLLKEAGVTRFAPGSAVVKQTDPALAYTELLALALS